MTKYEEYLHFTMLLLKRSAALYVLELSLYLHFTMLLLKHTGAPEFNASFSVFTFHYASIKTGGIL